MSTLVKIRVKKVQVSGTITHNHRFADETTKCLESFAATHRTDDRKSFRVAWECSPDIAKIISIERERIDKLIGYVCDDINAKLYHSARYYYRKKPITNDTVVPKQRKVYTRSPKPMLDAMDIHIDREIRASIETIGDKRVCCLAPSDAEPRFFALYPEWERTEFTKKTYKNRFYLKMCAITKPPCV